MTDNDKTYTVQIGGAPPSTAKTYYDSRDALEEAWADALAMCEAKGYDPLDLDEYGSEGGDWGVCPDGDDGAYWPYIRVANR